MPNIKFGSKQLDTIDRQFTATCKQWREIHADMGHVPVYPEVISLRLNRPLAALFKKSKLSSRDPDHWKLLLFLVIEDVYASGHRLRKRGSAGRLEAAFLRAIVKALSDNPGIRTAAALAKKINENRPYEISERAIRNRIADVRTRARSQVQNGRYWSGIGDRELRALATYIDKRLPRKQSSNDS